MARKYPNDFYDYGNQPKKKKGGGSAVAIFVSTLLLVIAIGIFCFAAIKLAGFYLEYKKADDEYKNLEEQYVNDPADQAQEPDISIQNDDSGNDAPPEQQKPVLNNVRDLENPDTVADVIAGAATGETVENTVTKTLPLLRNPINFTDLHQINPDVIAWIRVGALEISYPVAQGQDNDYYLHRTFERLDNFAGCIFLNCDNSRFFTDQNSIVYGHNMKNGSMFGKLKDFKDQSVYNSNPYFWIFTEDLIYQYRIFSAAEVPVSGDPYKTRFSKDDFANFLRNIQAASFVDTHDVQVTSDDRIVTLSTCTGNDSVRFILEGKLEQIYISN